jgi:DNA-binding response OmpR family regulator
VHQAPHPTVIIATRDGALLQQASGLLHARGFDVLEAEGADDTERLLEDRRVDALVLDAGVLGAVQHPAPGRLLRAGTRIPLIVLGASRLDSSRRQLIESYQGTLLDRAADLLALVRTLEIRLRKHLRLKAARRPGRIIRGDGRST